MALVRNGKLLWSGVYGYTDLEHHRKLTVDAVFRVASISKSVTAWGVMRLVQQGLIRLDDLVQQFLDDWEFPPSEYSIHRVTIRRLLSNSAGMPLGNFGDEYSPEDNMPSLQVTLNQEVKRQKSSPLI